jgi:hypothetical protein
MLTRKHFENTARLIRTTGINDADRLKIAKEFSKMYAEENPHFKKQRFIKACGFGITEVKA